MGKPQNILKPVLNVSVDHCKTKLMSGMWRDKFLLLCKEREPEGCNSLLPCVLWFHLNLCRKAQKSDTTGTFLWVANKWTWIFSLYRFCDSRMQRDKPRSFPLSRIYITEPYLPLPVHGLRNTGLQAATSVHFQIIWILEETPFLRWAKKQGN